MRYLTTDNIKPEPQTNLEAWNNWLNWMHTKMLFQHPRAKRIVINSEMWECGYCRGRYLPSDNPFTCSERCDYLLDKAVDEARGK